MDDKYFPPKHLPSPLVAGAAVIRREFVDALFEFDWSHTDCWCQKCARLRSIFERLGLDFAKWNRGGPLEDVRRGDKDSDTDGPWREDLMFLGMVVREVRDCLEGKVQALGDYLEVPLEISNLLWVNGWGELLWRARDGWLWGSHFDEQPSWIISARRAFVDEMAKVAIPDESVVHEEVLQWIENDTAPDPQAAEAAQDAIIRQFQQRGMAYPSIPETLKPRVRLSKQGGITTTGVDIESIAGYGLELAGNRRNIPFDYLDERFPDYFVAHGRSNGYSSMWGLAARGGGLFASVQTDVWKLDMSNLETDDPDHAIAGRVSQIMEAYNKFLLPILSEMRRDIGVGVVFSSYRRDAFVVAKRFIGTSEPNPRIQLPPWWGCVLDLHRAFDNKKFDIGHAIESARTQARDSREINAAIDFISHAIVA
jgi:hypothetical protein